jgi:hypothetical protein
MRWQPGLVTKGPLSGGRVCDPLAISLAQPLGGFRFEDKCCAPLRMYQGCNEFLLALTLQTC